MTSLFTYCNKKYIPPTVNIKYCKELKAAFHLSNFLYPVLSVELKTNSAVP